ncbi:CUB and sushi domain-containing protein 3-like isoform X2 [Limulus polyphemus]|uniref:CUB and sushi domain-containing protein 3-like isoform X2 n=1 Tax=Limulus polyphemus TaxID=6850 RepID=A0ABM1T551_LIMPO|nr:CUB and sushi domain-containing protein 3-like isoform X2 [Limulus polyphemus]
MANLFSRIIISTLLYVHTLLLLEAEHCGYPGSPAYGKPKNVKNTYEPGETVTFSCNSGYFLIGANTRRCLSDGTWSGQLPVCDIALSPTGVTSASSSLDSYPPENVVDGNKQSCMFTRDAKPRWWRLDMGKAYHVLYVAITIPYSNSYQQFTTYVISVKNQNILYHRCSSFNGKFASQTVVLHCGDGQGIFGHYIHIEDNRPDFTYFALCQVDVIVLKERYACGEPDHPTQAYTTREHNTVEYHCVSGYRLKGNPRRRCLRSGQWDGLQRTCIEVTCRRLDEVQNGRVRMNGLRRNRPVQGSNAFYSCEGGYVLHGNATRECKEDGSWSGGDSSCYPINCGFPRHQTVGGKYYLLNETTTYQSMAKLECLDEHKAFGPSSLITCREDGTWSGSQASCVSEGNTDAAMRQSEDGDEFSLKEGVLQKNRVYPSLREILIALDLLVWPARVL